MKKVILCLTILLLGSMPAFGREPKEYDSDVIYDESKIPHYDLPPLLVTAEGKPVSTAEQWRNVRRPQILSLFSNLVYGRVPESPIEMEFEVKKIDSEFMGGKATRKDVQIRFSNDKGKAEMLVLVFVPNKGTKPVPAFMKHSFNNTKSRDFEAHPQQRDRLRNGWPLGKFFDRGYAFVAVYQQNLVGHNEVSFLNGIHPLFYQKGQSFPKAREWGVLSAVAWGAMRAMDYLETDSDVDHTRVAIMGHSKMGKATLWTAAQDERFAMAISAQSGCAGAALWRRRSGETLEKMVTRFPYWLCRNAWKFVNQEDDLPVDQHMLLACIAPRPVYVHSGIEDTWADPRGEYLSAYHASEVYRLLGKKGLTSESSPPVDEAIIESDVGYHIRKGGHSIEDQDWQHFLDFADYHLKKSAESEDEVVFTKQVEVFGLYIYATNTTGDDKLLHAANILAEYIDNDEDGIPDNPKIMKALLEGKGAIVMKKTEGERITGSHPRGQDLYDEETIPNARAQDRFDASLEEILHMVTDVGWEGAYPKVFVRVPGTEISNALDKARGGRFEEVPEQYSDGAWFTYDDETCDYDCQNSEYIYWALTSILGAQDYPGRLDQIGREWRLNTREKVKERDSAVYAILTNPEYKLPTVLPDGKYRAKTFTIQKYP